MYVPEEGERERERVAKSLGVEKGKGENKKIREK